MVTVKSKVAELSLILQKRLAVSKKLSLKRLPFDHYAVRFSLIFPYTLGSSFTDGYACFSCRNSERNSVYMSVMTAVRRCCLSGICWHT